tara:strand:+ start:268 stop:933 length:666 start_codon:yes stop_codon:yes gene_type:complete
MAYFDQFPDVLIPSPNSTRTSSNDFVLAKNLFKRGKIRDDFFENAVAFGRYSIRGDDRPDNVAKELYGDSSLDWVILLSNNMVSVRDEWPMRSGELQRYLNDKYSSDHLVSIKHYETKEIRNAANIKVLEKGQIVDESFTFTYSLGGINATLSGSNVMTSVSNYEYEVNKNDNKRTIHFLRQNYLQTIMEDMRTIMTYTDSSQYIDKRTKKGDNLRILSPR